MVQFAQADIGRGKPRERHGFSLGPYCLYPGERLLEKSGVAVRIGGRALDLLIALVAHAGEIVANGDLMRAVWPTTTVGEANLHVQMTALRRALDPDSARYIVNVAGQGYRFVAPVGPTDVSSQCGGGPAVVARRSRLPARLTRMIGREETVEALVADVRSRRFVTVVGSAGIGKTSVATDAARRLVAAFQGEIYFLDFAALEDERFVPTALLNALGLAVAPDQWLQALRDFADDRPLLLLFDNCEHVATTAASVAARIFGSIPNVSIIGTSRKPLRADGESQFHLSPLRCPPLHGHMSAADIAAFPAVQLLLERVSATVEDYVLSDADAPAAAEICARCDGIPLAIEIVSARVHAFGMCDTAAHLARRLSLTWHGQRTAPPRQQTLGAALSWSYDLLSDLERTTLQSLSTFVGTFTLEAAEAVIAAERAGRTDVAEAVAGLAAASLIAPVMDASADTYRMLQTTRDYAHDRLAERGDLDAVSRRHAAHFNDLLRRLNDAAAIRSVDDALAVYGEHVGNVRAGLEWAFGAGGDLDLAVSLAAQSGPLFIETSLLAECRSWMIRALEHLPRLRPDPRRELLINAALGVATMFTKGSVPDARDALERGLALALQLDEASWALRLLGMLNLFLQRIGDYPAALQVAVQGEAIAQRLHDPSATLLSQWTLGVSYYLSGDYARAQAHCESALAPRPASDNGRFSRFLGYDHHVRALVVEAESLWYRGYPDRSVQVVWLLVAEAERLGHPISLCIAYITALSELFRVNDLASARLVLDKFELVAKRYSLRPYSVGSLGARGILAFKLGKLEAALPMLEECVALIYQHKYLVLATGQACFLAEAQAAAGRFEAARRTIETAIALADERGDLFYYPDLLRVRAEIVADGPWADAAEAERGLRAAIALAQRQSALSWELRSAVSLGRLWVGAGRPDAARDLVEGVYRQFDEGFQTADLQAARRFVERTAGGETGAA
jgi:predicted ATPase/DNA-binding winged helix-turn-helix (wHTH) protein